MAPTRLTRMFRSAAPLAALLVTVSLFLPAAVSAAPGPPPAVPGDTVASVTAQLTALAQQTTTLTAAYNAADADMRAKQMQADIAAQVAGQAAADYRSARTELARMAVGEYEDSSLNRTTALLTSQNAQTYLDTLNTLSLISVHRAAVLTHLNDAQSKAAAAQASAAALLSDAQSRRVALGEQRAMLLNDSQRLQSLLAALTIVQMQAAAAQTQNAQTTSAGQAGAAAAQWATQCAQQNPTGAGGGCGGVSGYVNPFAGGSWTGSRTDQGVDWDAVHPEPVVAIGDGIVTYSNSHQSGWPGGSFLVYGLSSGSHAGTYIFVAENLTNLVPAGTRVRAGQQIAVAIPGGPNTEWGFAAPPGTGPNVATPYNGAPDGTATSAGKAFARFLIELGVTPAQQPGPGPDRP